MYIQQSYIFVSYSNVNLFKKFLRGGLRAQRLNEERVRCLQLAKNTNEKEAEQVMGRA